MRPSRSRLATLATLTALSFAALTACGGGDDPGQDTGSAGTPDAGSQDTGSEPTGEPAAGEADATVDVEDCTAVTAEEMAPLLGPGTGMAEVPPGGGGCTYALDDPEQPSVFLEQFTTEDFGDGWAGAQAAIASTAVGPIEGTPQTVGAGDDATVVVGPSVMGSGDALQSIGLVLVGDTIVRATVLQAVDLDEAALVTLTTDVLALVADRVGG